MHGTVFNIQRFSIHDGPGIRTTVFLKGCSLRCFWCHNPEGIRLQQEIQFYPDRCIGCDACIAACPHGATIEEAGQRLFQRERCRGCGSCVDTCYADARVLAGTVMTVEQVVEEARRDLAFYQRSGGGVTLSGGEPLLQRDFAREVLRQLQAAGVHTAVETAAHLPWESIEHVLAFTDLFMMDLKHMDPDKHRWATGAANERILANARQLAQSHTPIVFRVPVIPTVNDTPEEIAAIARFVAELNAIRAAAEPFQLELLPFHRLAGDKYRSLGLACQAAGLEPLSKERMAELAACGSTRELAVTHR